MSFVVQACSTLEFAPSLPLDKLAKHLLRVDGDEQTAPPRQNFAFVIPDFGDVDVLSAVNTLFHALNAQGLVQRNRLQIAHGHLDGDSDDVAQFVHLAHGFIEDGRNDAAVAVAGRSGEALAQTKTADEAVAAFVVGEAEPHALGIVFSAGEAVVLLQADVTGIVSADGFTRRFLARRFLLRSHGKDFILHELRILYHGFPRTTGYRTFRSEGMAGAAKSNSVYSIHPGIAMMQKWIRELPSKTGRSLEEWVELTRESGPPTEKERVEWLKKQYQLGTNYAKSIAERVDGKGTEDDSPEAYLQFAVEFVEAQYAGPRAALRPLYDQLLKLALSLGKEAKASPGKTGVSLYRNHVFASIKATTNSRIDVGLSLGNMKTPKRLIDTGGYEKKDRITRRIEVKSKNDVDEELKKWLKKAYELDGK